MRPYYLHLLKRTAGVIFTVIYRYTSQYSLDNSLSAALCKSDELTDFAGYAKKSSFYAWGKGLEITDELSRLMSFRESTILSW